MWLYERLTRVKMMSEFTYAHSCRPINFLFQAGMIRMEQEEFFIEPVERGDGVIEEEEVEGGGGRTHIVYRSSAVKKAPIGSAAADFHSRGQSVAPTVPSSTFKHPSLAASHAHFSSVLCINSISFWKWFKMCILNISLHHHSSSLQCIPKHNTGYSLLKHTSVLNHSSFIHTWLYNHIKLLYATTGSRSVNIPCCQKDYTYTHSNTSSCHCTNFPVVKEWHMETHMSDW